MIVAGQTLEMTRGDSESLTVSIKNRPFATGDVIEMTVRKKCTDPTVAFKKKVTTFDSGKAIIEINPADTKGLDFGKYTYDIQWTDSTGSVTTIVKPTKANFILSTEVTY